MSTTITSMVAAVAVSVERTRTAVSSNNTSQTTSSIDEQEVSFFLEISDSPQVAAAAKTLDDAKSIVDQLDQGAKAARTSAASFDRTAAMARLEVLKLLAQAAAAAGDAKQAKAIAAEVVQMIRQLKAEDGADAADASADTTGGVPATDGGDAAASADETASDGSAPAAGNGDDATTPSADQAAADGSSSPVPGQLATSDGGLAVQGTDVVLTILLRLARQVLEIARRATKPGSDEQRFIDHALSEVGGFAAASDLVGLDVQV
jgi:hypothetical protein